MATHSLDTLKRLASRYIWWQTPDQSLSSPERLVIQVMNIGDFYDVQILINELGIDALRNALLNAQAGQFNARSWHYWHYRLSLTAASGIVPPAPVRIFH